MSQTPVVEKRWGWAAFNRTTRRFAVTPGRGAAALQRSSHVLGRHDSTPFERRPKTPSRHAVRGTLRLWMVSRVGLKIVTGRAAPWTASLRPVSRAYPAFRPARILPGRDDEDRYCRGRLRTRKFGWSFGSRRDRNHLRLGRTSSGLLVVRPPRPISARRSEALRRQKRSALPQNCIQFASPGDGDSSALESSQG